MKYKFSNSLLANKTRTQSYPRVAVLTHLLNIDYLRCNELFCASAHFGNTQGKINHHTIKGYKAETLLLIGLLCSESI